MQILFFGSSSYCLPVLKSLFSNFQIAGIVTKPIPSPVMSFAKENKLPLFTPKNKEHLLQLKNKLKSLNADIAVVSDYGLIIPNDIFLLPKYKTLNIHFSNLPHLRGASPVQFTILLGEKSAWITIIIMNEDMDTGDIVWKKEIPLAGNETTRVLYEKLFQIGAAEIPTLINLIIEGKIIPEKQDHAKATYTKIFTRADGFIQFELIQKAIYSEEASSELLNQWPLFKVLTSQFKSKFQMTNDQLPMTIDRALRALSPWPGVWTEIQITQSTNNPIKKRLKILNAHLQPTTYNLQLDVVQLEGKKPVTWRQFVEGYPLLNI